MLQQIISNIVTPFVLDQLQQWMTSYNGIKKI